MKKDRAEGFVPIFRKAAVTFLSIFSLVNIKRIRTSQSDLSSFNFLDRTVSSLHY